ncbi:ABC transporter ATP-binding protein [Alicyclobacillus kakegawensis]|uniref:ABC transporter ATP-binding protein n=1 Tax=Alicyclobacillus kakegawensis TaxID=392012 RepID=UPI0009FAC290|nr:ABC transporter ATP-binding protein [Alicyclobacillus kakegawensis]
MATICELVRVHKRYGRRIVLDDYSLTVADGEMVAITGKSGAGKTTVLNLMGLLEKPDKGVVRVFGRPSPQIGSRQASRLLRTRIGYLFQNYALVDEETVDANLEVALMYAKKSKRERQRQKETALAEVGLEIPLHSKVYELSGGEQQRVAVARILLKPCDLILADEPTGSLDACNRDAILEILKNLNRAGKTIVIATHDPHVVAACTRTVQLEYEKMTENASDGSMNYIGDVYESNCSKGP